MSETTPDLKIRVIWLIFQILGEIPSSIERQNSNHNGKEIICLSKNIKSLGVPSEPTKFTPHKADNLRSTSSGENRVLLSK